MKTVEEILNALPPEDKKRIEKLSAASKKSIEETVVSILSEGVSTPTVTTALLLTGGAFIF
jgi:hypothetical protein